MAQCVIGIDVGTGSVRAGLFDLQGQLRHSAVCPIEMWNPKPNHVEQSSDNIWNAIGQVIRVVRSETRTPPEHVLGISFDATCSLVVLDKQGEPLAVNDENADFRNVIVWMDHRALVETAEINAGNYDVLKYVGGKLSPEMETPKLKWLKNHLPETWDAAGKFFDLADYLTYRATGLDARSLCTVTCKWTYLGHEGEKGRWDETYFKAIGLEDVLGEKIGTDIRPMGSFLGKVNAKAAEELAVSTETAVGVGMIDAHAGGLGVLGAVWEQGEAIDLTRLESALALIGGTSNCHMAVSREPKFIPGIWGPYYGAMVPGLWLTEGGQSAAGSAIDHVIYSNTRTEEYKRAAEELGLTIYSVLNEVIADQTSKQGLAYSALLTKDFHVVPDFLGNRSPIADPHICAIVDGLTLDESLESLAVNYYATLQGVAYGTRDIVRAMNASGYHIDTLYVTGGGTKNALWLQEHADATGLNIVLPKEPEAVLLGAAMLAAHAAGIYASLPEAMQAMSGREKVIAPNPATKAYHDAKFAIFREMYGEQAKRRTTMSEFIERKNGIVTS